MPQSRHYSTSFVPSLLVCKRSLTVSRQLGTTQTRLQSKSRCLSEIQHIHLRLMTELVRIFVAFQPALLPLLHAACAFAEKYVALLRLEAQFEGEAAFELTAAPCKELQAALIHTKDAMREFVIALHRRVTESPLHISSSSAARADVSALKQLVDKLRTLLRM